MNQSNGNNENGNNKMLLRLADGLENLLGQIKDSQAEFAAIKSELAVLHENVKVLSKIVRDGDGNMSILTKIALLDQKINDILKWQDQHQETHQRLRGDVSQLRNGLEELQRQLVIMNAQVQVHDKRLEREVRVEQKSIDNEMELAHTERLSIVHVRSERNKFVLKVCGAIVAAVLTFLAGYIANKYGATPSHDTAPIHMQ